MEAGGRFRGKEGKEPKSQIQLTNSGQHPKRDSGKKKKERNVPMTVMASHHCSWCPFEYTHLQASVVHRRNQQKLSLKTPSDNSVTSIV